MGTNLSREQLDIALRQHLGPHGFPVHELRGSMTSTSKERLIEMRKLAISSIKRLMETAEEEKRSLTESEQAAIDEGFRLIEFWKKNIDGTGRGSPVGLALGKRADTGFSMRTADGEEVRAFAPGESVHEWYRSKRDVDDYGGLTLGAFLRSMVTGPRSEDEKRALAEGTPSAGGVTVPQIVLAEFIDRLRARSTVIEAGARTIPLDTQKTSIAVVTGDPAIAWRNENALVAESEPTFDSVTFTARTLGCIVPASRELLQDSVNAQEVLSKVLAQAVALELDRVCLVGSGVAPEPKGVSNFSIGSVAAGGALTSYDKLLDVLQTLKEADAVEPYTFIEAPRTEIALAKLKEATTNAPLPIPPALGGVTFRSTTQIPTDLGGGSNESIVVAGDFRELWIGMRMQAQIEILRELYAKNYQFAFLVALRADVQLAHAASFCKLTGITAT